MRTLARLRMGKSESDGVRMLNQPFFQITLPLMATFIATVWAATWMQNKRLEEISKRLDDIVARLRRIEEKLDNFEHRITALETSKWGR